MPTPGDRLCYHISQVGSPMHNITILISVAVR